MTGLSALNILCLKDLYTPFTQSELDHFKQSIKTKKQLVDEIKEVRGYMIETEKCYAKGAFTKEEYELSVAKLTQLFKTLLYKKEALKTPQLSSSMASSSPTYFTL